MTTLATLRNDIVTYTLRDNLPRDLVDSFIRLGENTLYRRVRVLEMRRSTAVPIGTNGAGPLPERFLGLRAVSIKSNQLDQGAEINYLPPDQFQELVDGPDAVQLRTPFYTLGATVILVFPAPETANTMELNISYFSRFPALQDSNPNDFTITNHLLQNEYDIVLFACLIHAYDFIGDVDLEAKYTAKFESAVAELDRQEGRKMRSGPHIRRSTTGRLP